MREGRRKLSKRITGGLWCVCGAILPREISTILER